MRAIFTLIIGICCTAFNDAKSIRFNEPRSTLRGRVVFPSGSREPVESDGVLTVELQDTSLMDAPAKIIGQGVGKAIRFPMAFAVKFPPKEISKGHSYSLQISIRNKKNELLYVNDFHVSVVPTGANRTKFIDVPVVLVAKSKPKEEKKHQWPELLGTNGQEAVNIIKKETGFSQVVAIRAGSMVTMDYRNDRVRVYVDKNGIVTRTPIIA
ncbi:unnamed protein product [Adineta ricciae]|uniref:Uncharacterized protein n=1 Tax=Adineta ricciae TaxID=249248 RepID=A0A815GGM2_ADIRI|nr:unnamed protein product [Adineta ricciae]CAF1338573.1 unnamed protein product [Adineta ricciae]